jgi:aminoglycoside 3-N-acetyltransferase I
MTPRAYAYRTSMCTPVRIRRLRSSDVALLRALNEVFGEAFGESDEYTDSPPSDNYLSGLLAEEHIIALAAVVAERVVGGLVAYELDKFERQRREVYIYDLAVNSSYRRQGIATALIERLREIAAQRAAWVIYVQADYGDEAAIALYEKLGSREDVIHFDISVASSNQIKPP